nr:MAG TPA: hypothetical protein [Caudoviricetes sp.]
MFSPVFEVKIHENSISRLSYKHKTFTSLSRTASDCVYSHQAYLGMVLA